MTKLNWIRPLHFELYIHADVLADRAYHTARSTVSEHASFLVKFTYLLPISTPNLSTMSVAGRQYSYIMRQIVQIAISFPMMGVLLQ